MHTHVVGEIFSFSQITRVNILNFKYLEKKKCRRVYVGGVTTRELTPSMPQQFSKYLSFRFSFSTSSSVIGFTKAAHFRGEFDLIQERFSE